MAKNALQYITKSDPRYQYGARTSEAGESNAFDQDLSQIPLTESYWRNLGYGGPVMSGTNSEATDAQISPELLAYLQSNGLQMGTDQSAGLGALIGADGNALMGSEFSNKTNDDRAFIAGMLGIGGAGALMAGGAGAGTSGAEALGEAGGYGFTSGETAGGLTELGSAGLSDGTIVGSLEGAGPMPDGWSFQNVNADPSAMGDPTRAAMYGEQGYGAGMSGAETGIYDAGVKAGGSTFGSGLTDFFSGNGSFGDYLRAGQLVGGLYAQNQATGAAKEGNSAQSALLNQMFQQNRTDNQPLLDTRNSALTQINSLLKDPSTITNDPGYQFGLKQGTNQLNNRAAASGNYYSGAQMKAAQQFGQDYAGTKLDQSLNRLTNVAGLGQVGANNNQSNNTNFGTQGGNALQQGGNIRGSGYLGSFNTANNAANGWMQDDIWNRLLKGNGG